MEGHSDWYEQLFAPTFTRDDVVDEESKETSNGGAKSYYTDVYSQVVLEEEIKEEKEKDRAKVEEMLEKMMMQDEHDNVGTSATPAAGAASKSVKPGGVWEEEDLKLFREAYTKLKEKAVKLLCIIETKNLKIKEVREENKSLKKQLRVKDGLVADLSREKELLQGYATSHENICNGLEEKLRFYEDCNNDLKEVVVQRQQEINIAKSNLQKEIRLRQQISSKLEMSENEHRAALISLEESLKGETERLTQQLEELRGRNCLVEEKCLEYKKSFLNLQQHFMHGGVESSGAQVDGKGIDNKRQFIGIADLTD